MVDLDTPGGGWICLRVIGCVMSQYKHLWKWRKKVSSLFFVPIPSLSSVCGSGEKEGERWKKEASLHLSSDVSVMEKTIQSLPQELGGGVVGT